MKKKILLLSAVVCLLATTASAQFILGVQGSYLSGSPNAGTQYGVGAQGKIKVSNRVAVGGTFRTWFSNTETTGSGSSATAKADALSTLAGTLEFYLGSKVVQPYIGTDAGLYFTNVKITTGSGSGNIDQSNKKTYFGVAPKAGIQFNTGFISPFIQAQYHWLFGGGTDITIPGIGDTPIDAKSYDKFFTLDAGILFQIGRVGGKKK
jgi:hypothetical protein